MKPAQPQQHPSAAPGAIPSAPSAQNVRVARWLATHSRPRAERFQPAGWRLVALRQVLDAAGRGPLPRGALSWRTRYGGVPGVWVQAATAGAANGVIVHAHGGGFVFGSSRSHRGLAYSLSRVTRRPVFLPDYRRAPRSPYPAAVQDMGQIYRTLLTEGMDPGRIVVSGDSAGGHLLAGLLHDLGREGGPAPGAAVFFSPMLDLSCRETLRRDAAHPDPMIPAPAAIAAGLAYAGQRPVDSPGLDVLSTDMQAWPPVLIQVSRDESLGGDAERLHERLTADQVEHTYQVWPGQIHVLQAFAGLIPEARQALRHVAEFLRQHTGH